MCCGGKLTAFLKVNAIPKRVCASYDEMIEITPVAEVIGPPHKLDLVGVVSNQPAHDEDDIVIRGSKIFIRPKTYSEVDRVFTITYHVNCSGINTFASTKVIVEKNVTQFRGEHKIAA